MAWHGPISLSTAQFPGSWAAALGPSFQQGWATWFSPIPRGLISKHVL